MTETQNFHRNAYCRITFFPLSSGLQQHPAECTFPSGKQLIETWGSGPLSFIWQASIILTEKVQMTVGEWSKPGMRMTMKN